MTGTWRPAPIEACVFNWRKGLWHARLDRWTTRHTSWIVVAFPYATALTRGVRP